MTTHLSHRYKAKQSRATLATLSKIARYALICLIPIAMAVQAASKPPDEAAKAQAKINVLEKEQQRLLEDAKQRANTQQMRDRIDEMEKRIIRENSRIRYISPYEKEPVYRAYYQRFCRRLEQAGPGELPKKQGKTVYGKVIASLRIAADGKLQTIEIERSRSPALAEHAQKLLRSFAPYEAFPAEMAEEIDTLVIVTQMGFMPDNPAKPSVPGDDC